MTLFLKEVEEGAATRCKRLCQVDAPESTSQIHYKLIKKKYCPDW